jgi:hypothetical protein
MNDAEEVFRAEPMSVEQVFITAGRGFYVPSYQRPYAWSAQNVGALFTNVCEGIAGLRDMGDSITFIGTLIFVHDNQYKTVEPQVVSELPSAVWLVIDGQQRMTTSVLFYVALHEALVRSEAKLERSKLELPWLSTQIVELYKRIETCLAIDMHQGEGVLQYYPRIIRAHDDVWAKKKGVARYDSPTAQLIASYLGHAKSEARGAFKWIPRPTEEERGAEYELVAKNLRQIQKLLKDATQGVRGLSDESDLTVLQDLSVLADLPDLQKRLFAHVPPQEVLSHWRNLDEPNSDVNVATRFVMFARYFLQRLAVTQVLVKKEEYAFDLFEALNTTGEPLTAYETFKPLVIKMEGLERFQVSPSASHLQRVDSFLSKHAAEDRRKASDRILIPFALYERGVKLGKKLRDQRNWLRRSFEGEGMSKEGRRDFLKGMATVSDFVSHCWDFEDAGALSDQLKQKGMDARDIQDVLLGLSVLRDSKHDITVALLSRFFEQASLSATGQSLACREFASAIRAVVAYLALWRGSRQGTDNIDRLYRDLMSRGDDTSPFKRCGGMLPTVEALTSILRQQLSDARVGQASAWIERASKLDVYKQSRELTKLLLLAASHDQIPDSSQPGFTKPGRVGCCVMMSVEQWNAGYDIEHIAPVVQPAGDQLEHGYDSAIYASERLHTLGNLILLPADPNRSVGNRGWPVKSLYYRAISSEDPARVSQLIVDANADGAGLSEPTQMLLERSRYLPHLRAVAQVNSSWSADLVRSRSLSLAERAWHRLAPWLNL